MPLYLLLIFSILMLISTYFIARSHKWSELYHLFPEKYLIKNKFILAYLAHPKNKVPIWLFVWHCTDILAFLVILILYIILWINNSTYNLLTSYWSMLTYFIYLCVCFIPVSLIHGTMLRKYIEKKSKNKPQ